MESDSQEEYVKKLETKLSELREQRIKVDEANEILRKKLQTLTAHLDNLDLKYGKKEDLSSNDEEAPLEVQKNKDNADEKQINENDNVEDSQNVEKD